MGTERHLSVRRDLSFFYQYPGHFLQESLLFLIRCYWRCVPKEWRRECIFRENCSRYIYDITYNNGFHRGWKALKTRWKRCRPGYRVEWHDGEFQVRFADGYMAKEEEIAESVLHPYKTALQETTSRILSSVK